MSIKQILNYKPITSNITIAGLDKYMVVIAVVYLELVNFSLNFITYDDLMPKFSRGLFYHQFTKAYC